MVGGLEMAVRHPLRPAVPGPALSAAEGARAGGLEPREEALGHRFAIPALLDQALTHRSAYSSRGPVPEGYERLEFLGDRVLGLVVAELLVERYPREQEGELTRRHTSLVRRDALVRVARQIGIGEHLRLSKGEADSGARQSPSLLADALEAVIAAIHLDGGIEAARGFISRYWDPLMAADRHPPRDAKTALQEWAQGLGLPLPAYETVATEGSSHQPLFTVSVAVEGKPAATAQGRSKRAAEQLAAAALLAALRAKETKRG
jgi:ribonuclease III